MKKIKVLTLSDHPLSPSGVGIQTRYMIESLLQSGKFKVVSFGGAMKHPRYDPMKTEEYEDDWIIYPVDGYGTQDMIRSVIRTEKPDILWFMTDPRFYGWLWDIENEIRPLIPMVYYHVWDNYPLPRYNNKHYRSNDKIICISKLTHDIVQKVAPTVDSVYLPHAVDSNIFKKLDIADKKQTILEMDEDKFVFFWNNRNARRKMSGSLIFWFKDFLDKVGHDKATLIMHTDPKDQHGQDLEMIIEDLNMDKGQIMISKNKVDPPILAKIYNAVDCTINISDAEGFGLATLESLSCGTPIIANVTGGLQEQITDGKKYFGIALHPTSKAIIGSQQVPYIYEDRVSGDDVIAALEKMYNIWKNDREEYNRMATEGRNHVLKNYNFDDYKKKWLETMLDIHESYGSWKTRKNHKNWDLVEV